MAKLVVLELTVSSDPDAFNIALHHDNSWDGDNTQLSWLHAGSGRWAQAYTDLILTNESGENIVLLINCIFDAINFDSNGLFEIGGESGGKWLTMWVSDDDDVAAADAFRRARDARASKP